LRKFWATILFAVLLFSGLPAALADTAAAQQITFQQAMDMALKNSSTLRKDSLTIDQSKYNRDSASQSVKFIPIGQNTDPTANKAFSSLQSSDLSWQSAKRNYDADKDSVVMSVYQNYYGVLQAQVAVDVAQQAENSAYWQHRTAAMNYQVGNKSQSDMLKADADYTNAQAAVDKAKKALDDAYQKFNQLVGLMPGDIPVLSDQPEFTPLVVNSLDAEVARAIGSSPKIWNAQQLINQAKVAADIYSFNSPVESQTYKAKQLQVPIAQQNAASTQDAMDQSVRSLYYSIQQLENNYDSLKKNVNVQEDNLRVIQVKYKIGMATKTDEAAAQSALAQAQQTLTNLVCQHQILVQTFKTPWASGG